MIICHKRLEEKGLSKSNHEFKLRKVSDSGESCCFVLNLLCSKENDKGNVNVVFLAFRWDIPTFKRLPRRYAPSNKSAYCLLRSQ